MLVMVGIATMQPVFRMHRHCAESSQAPSHLVPQQPYFTDGNSEAHKGWEPGPSLPYLWMVELGGHVLLDKGMGRWHCQSRETPTF